MARRRPIMSQLYPYRRERGPNGRGLCRYCGEEVPNGRRTWCCDEHFNIARLECDSGYQRELVFERDHGVCAICGTDTKELKKLMREMLIRDRGNYWGFQYEELKRALGFNADKSLWEADHLIPVVEGGADKGLSNLRTLCVICHKRETKKLAKHRAKKSPSQ